MTSFNPVYRIGRQIAEAIRAHRSGVSKEEARERAVELLDSVGIPNAERRVDDYPHQFSGGMRQRAMIAMALALDPEVLIADEPTTALDVTVQAQILALLEQLNRERGLATILITHDLGVVAEVADRVLVMYAGGIVERARSTRSSTPPAPLHPGPAGSLTRSTARPERLPLISGAPPAADLPEAARSGPAARTSSALLGAAGLEPAGGRPALDRCWLAGGEAGARWSRARSASRRQPREPPSPCSRSPTWSSTSRSSAACWPTARSTGCAPSTASASASAAARRSASSASPAAASRRSAAPSCSCSRRPRARSASRAARSPGSRAGRCGRCGARCR